MPACAAKPACVKPCSLRAVRIAAPSVSSVCCMATSGSRIVLALRRGNLQPGRVHERFDFECLTVGVVALILRRFATLGHQITFRLKAESERFLQRLAVLVEVDLAALPPAGRV